MALCLSFSVTANAQPKAISTTWSYSGIGIGYEYIISHDTFLQVDAKADMTGVFNGNDKVPGPTASFTWNMIFARSVSENGCDICWFAGPGAAVGWSKDFRSSEGFIFGIKGRIGMECCFKRNIAISVSISPTLGMHASENNGMTNMRLYKNGLIYCLIPEVGIKYSFGK